MYNVVYYADFLLDMLDFSFFLNLNLKSLFYCEDDSNINKLKFMIN